MKKFVPGMTVHTYNPSTQEAKAGEPPCVSDEPFLSAHTEVLSGKENNASKIK